MVKTPADTQVTAGQPTRPVPPALRSQRSGWRDPRILIGVVIVAGAVLVGAKVMAAADDSVDVAVLAHDLPAGATIGRVDLERHRVHFDSSVDAARYFTAGALPAKGSVLAHASGAGELLARTAVSTEMGDRLVEVPLSLAPEDLPATVRRGVVVDVWVTPKTPANDTSAPRARLVLDDVAVISVPRIGEALAPTTNRQVIVGVEPVQQDQLAAALGRMADGRVVLTRQPAAPGAPATGSAR